MGKSNSTPDLLVHFVNTIVSILNVELTGFPWDKVRPTLVIPAGSRVEIDKIRLSEGYHYVHVFEAPGKPELTNTYLRVHAHYLRNANLI